MKNFDMNTIKNEDAGYGHPRGSDPTEDEILMRIDVAAAVRSLSPGHQLICRLLAQGVSQTDIAREIGKSRKVVSYEIGKIRHFFKQRNLQIYIKD